MQVIQLAESKHPRRNGCLAKYENARQSFSLWSVQKQVTHAPKVSFEAWSQKYKANPYIFAIHTSLRAAGFFMKDLVDIFNSFSNQALDEFSKDDFDLLNQFTLAMYNATTLSFVMTYDPGTQEIDGPESFIFVDVDDVAIRLKHGKTLVILMMGWQSKGKTLVQHMCPRNLYSVCVLNRMEPAEAAIQAMTLARLQGRGDAYSLAAHMHEV